jgi:hypothetical protein
MPGIGHLHCDLPEWHEIKHDGIRVIARKNAKRVRLYSRPGNDLTLRFPLIVETIRRLRSRSCIIDGEAVACGEDGIAVFERIRYRRHDGNVFMWAFDIIELNGDEDDLKREPLGRRKSAVERLIARAGYGVRFNEAHRARWAWRFRACVSLGPGRDRVGPAPALNGQSGLAHTENAVTCTVHREDGRTVNGRSESIHLVLSRLAPAQDLDQEACYRPSRARCGRHS